MLSMCNIISLYISLLLLFLSAPTSSSRWTCNEEGQCEDRNLTCSSREDCFVECSANWACRGTTIECPTGYECHIKCHYDGEGEISEHGQYICYNMVIQATDSTLLTINVSIGYQPSFPAPRTMQNARITCPHKKDIINGNDNGDTTNGDNDVYKPCQIYCDGDDLMRVTTINAMEGMNDLYIESIQYTKPWCIRNTELKCGINYDVSCPLTNIAPFGCQDPINGGIDQSCETMVVGPTLSPIFSSETLNPSQSPSNEPTKTPIMDGEIGAPTVSPTRPPTPLIKTTMDEEAAEIDDGKEGGLTDGEIVIVILIPLFFCILFLLLCFCYVRRKDDKKRRDDYFSNHRERINSNENGHQRVKEVHDEDMEEKGDVMPLRTGDVV